MEKEKQKKIQVAILGGAFNPITKGHLQIAHYVLGNTDVEEVWLSPCYSHPYNKAMTSATHRLNMCEMATLLEPKIRVIDCEIRRLLTCTYDFLKYLILKPKYEFSYIIGMDNANNFDRWIESEKLKKMVRFITVSRQGIKFKEKADWCKKFPHIYLDAGNEIMNISSSQIRRWIEEGDFIKVFDNLPESVYHYAIVKNNLYSGLSIRV